VITALTRINNAILFIDEIHTIVGAGATSSGSMDASNIMKPFLASGEIRCIGSTTYEEYQNHLEKDRALSRRNDELTERRGAHVSHGKEARYRGLHPLIRDDIAGLVLRDGGNQISLRVGTDEDEYGIHGELLAFAGGDVSERDAAHLLDTHCVLRRADLRQHRVEPDSDIGIREDSLRERRLRPESVSPVDHPLVAAASVASLARSDARAVIPSHKGKHGHPIVLAREVATSIVCGDLPGPTMREVLKAVEAVDLDVDDPGVTANCNTPAALSAALKTMSFEF